MSVQSDGFETTTTINHNSGRPQQTLTIKSEASVAGTWAYFHSRRTFERGRVEYSRTSFILLFAILQDVQRRLDGVAHLVSTLGVIDIHRPNRTGIAHGIFQESAGDQLLLDRRIAEEVDE